MRNKFSFSSLFYLLCLLYDTAPFTPHAEFRSLATRGRPRIRPCHDHFHSVVVKMAKDGEASVMLSTDLTEEKVKELFAWVSRAFAGDEEYNNLMLAFAVVFGDLGKDSSDAGRMAHRLKAHAMSMLPDDEEAACGQPFSTDDREIASLGAMGAAQWTGKILLYLQEQAVYVFCQLYSILTTHRC